MRRGHALGQSRAERSLCRALGAVRRGSGNRQHRLLEGHVRQRALDRHDCDRVCKTRLQRCVHAIGTDHGGRKRVLQHFLSRRGARLHWLVPGRNCVAHRRQQHGRYFHPSKHSSVDHMYDHRLQRPDDDLPGVGRCAQLLVVDGACRTHVQCGRLAYGAFACQDPTAICCRICFFFAKQDGFFLP